MPHYCSKQTLAAYYDLSVSMVEKLVREMRETGQYGKFTLSGEKLLRIKHSAFHHYLENRERIKHDLFYPPYNKKAG